MDAKTLVKTLPVADLALVAVIYQSGEYEDGEGYLRAEYEYDVLNEEAFGRAVIPKETIRCECCGHALKYACIVEHTPFKRLYFVGRQCVRTIEGLRRFGRQVEDMSVAVAERAACNIRERAVLEAASDDFKAAYAWAAHPEAPAIAKDIKAKVRRYGSPSEAQKALLVKIWHEDIARRANATGVAPTGRQSVSGTVLSVKQVPDQFNEGQFTNKVLIDLGNGARSTATRRSPLSRKKARLSISPPRLNPPETTCCSAFGNARPSGRWPTSFLLDL